MIKLTGFLFAIFAFPVFGQEIVTLDNVPDAKPIKGDEPVRAEFSAEMAARYLDTASLAWQHSRDCATCHTNMSYLMARPALKSALPDSGEVREFYEAYFTERWEGGKEAPKTDYDPVVVSTALVFNDLQTTGKMGPTTRESLDTMWKTQREDGGWKWAKCGWAPMEIDDHFGVTLAALTVGLAPENYAETEAARAGLAKMRTYLENHPPKSLHHRVMIAWASLRVPDLMEAAEREAVLGEMLGIQLPDGGWSTPGFLADWKEYERKDGKPHDPKTSDAYGTGLALIFAREMGKPAADPALQRGVVWLKSNQRESGKWFTRSPAKDSRHYITNTGCAYAVLGLQACGELPGWPFENL
ncbi:MAG: squalene--hopene cyclase [Verrucomicrobiales bacterium]|nr:squalene--hopene cyclase [Verrucomicrobiales bacterium]